MTLVKPIHSKVTGRTRFKVAGLQHDPEAKFFLERTLAGRNDVLHISASAVTGNVLVSYNSGNTPQSIGRMIEKAVVEYRRNAENHQQNATPSALPPAPALRQPAPLDRTGVSPPQTGDFVGDCWHCMNREQVAAVLQTDLKQGLSREQVSARFQQYGPNQLPEAEPRPGWKIVWEQLNSLPIYLLGAAAGVSLVTSGLLDAVVIAGVVAANAAIGYFTESKAEKTIQSLKKQVQPMAEVIRESRAVTLRAQEVVLGDLLVLKPGIYIAADCRIVRASYLNIDESMLTGESLPARKHTHKFNREDAPLADRRNMGFMGTLVTGGQGLALVIATGRFTQIGQLHIMLEEARPPETPIERQLGRLGDQLVLMCLAVCSVVFVIGFLRGYGLVPMLRMAISLAASAVPEGLPAAATINFALGITGMRKHRVLVRHLQAVETLGSVQVICLDKTGTLTENRMSARRILTGWDRIEVENGRLLLAGSPLDISGRPDLQYLVAACALCNEAKVASNKDRNNLFYGSATETALLQLALDSGLDVADFIQAHHLLKIKLRSERRLFMSTLHRTPDQDVLLTMKGSPPEVLAMCDRWMIGDEIRPLDETTRLMIENENEAMSARALRVLGFACKTLESDEGGQLESGLIWLGLVGMSDPVRPGVDRLIRVFHRAGIKTAMITGDQGATAYAVAESLDLSAGGPLEILDSTELTALDEETLKALARTAHVYARVSPAHKLKIVQALQATGNTVAMTGDGINDGPALKAANIGIALGRSGTDVARDVADIVLEEDQLAVLARALGDGRSIYSNIRKSVHFFLSTNLSEIMLMFSALSLGVGFPLNVMQLLWINLISDILPGLALSMEAPEPGIMSRPPRDSQAPLFSSAEFKKMARESAAITAGALAAYGYGITRYGLGPSAGSLAFQSLTIGQLLHAFSCRSEYSSLFRRSGLPPNPYLTASIGGSLALQVLTMVWPPLRRFLGPAPPGMFDLAILGATTLVPLLLNEAAKKQEEYRA